MANEREIGRGNGMERLDMQAPILGWWRVAMTLPLEMGVESMRFASRRIQAHADHLAACSQCRTVSEAIQAQSQFTERMIDDYRNRTEVAVREIQEVMPHTRAA